MITKRNKVQIVLRSSEMVVFKHTRNILEDYINNCDNNELGDFEEQIYEYAGIEDAIGNTYNTLAYICDNAIVED